jgi:hypothetical protein
MTTVFYLQVEDDDAFLQVKSSTSDQEREGLPHFLDVLDEMVENEKMADLLEGDFGRVIWRDLTDQLHEPAVQRFLKQHGIEVESIGLYPLYKVGESETINESWPRESP